MAETAPEFVAAQRVVPDPLLDRGGGRLIPCAHERYRELHRLPRRAIAVDLRRVDREAPHQPSARIDRSFGERHRRALFDATLSDRSHHMVARSEELASQSSLTVSWGAQFPRINWDLHSALGFWCFFFVLLWGISGIYFSFPRWFDALLLLVLTCRNNS